MDEVTATNKRILSHVMWMDDICKLGQAANQRRRQGWISLTVAKMTGGVPKLAENRSDVARTNLGALKDETHR
jgi:hypothetical protein